MNSDEAKITELVLSTVESFPVRRRAEYLRSMARLCSEDALVVQLSQEAELLEEIDAKHHQLVLDFKSRVKPAADHGHGRDGNGRAEG